MTEPVVPPAVTPWVFDARCVRVIDGDTFEAEIRLSYFVPAVDLGFRVVVPGHVVEQVISMPVRVAHVDTPERGKPGYREATDFVVGWMETADALSATDWPLRIATYKPREKYGRWLAETSRADGDRLDTDLLAFGLAVPYEGGAKVTTV
jgi:endonuclease YncB( thermonuclease family)